MVEERDSSFNIKEFELHRVVKLASRRIWKTHQVINIKTQKFYGMKKLWRNEKLGYNEMDTVGFLDMMRNFSHPNILQTYNYFNSHDQKYLCIVSEFGYGGNLNQFVREQGMKGGLLGQVHVLGILKQILTGLEVLHSQSLIHHDLKPENIFFCGNVVKIGDIMSTVMKIGNTIPNMAGSKYKPSEYTAPEILNGTKLYEADIYSLGKVAHDLCSIGNPHMKTQIHGKTRVHLESPPLDENIYEQQLRELIASMLSNNPIDRPPLERIREVLSGCSGYNEELNIKASGTENDREGGVYTGEVDPGSRVSHGWGSRSLPNGWKYTGQWVNGKIWGYGVLVRPTGVGRKKEVLTGQFFDGKLEGKGTAIVDGGERYDGLWSEGLRYGHGIMAFPDGGIYVGNFINDFCHGIGKYTGKFGTGYIYEGDYRDGMKDGNGVETLKGGHRYDGQFSRDERNGEGTLYAPDGTSEKFIFKNGEVLQAIPPNTQPFGGQ